MIDGVIRIEFKEKVFRDKVKVIVKEDVLKVLKAVEKAVGNGYEFSVLFKGRWDDEKGAYVVEPDYYIPEQKVRSSFVEITEDVGGKILSGYTVAFHKHPSGLREFSGHDYENICAVFPISLLYVDGTIPVGTVKVPLQDANAVVLVPADIVIEDGNLPEVVGVEKIKKETFTSSYGHDKLFRGTSGLFEPDNGLSSSKMRYVKYGDLYGDVYDYGDVKDIDDELEDLAKDLKNAITREEVEDILRMWGFESLDEVKEVIGLEDVVDELIRRFGNVRVR